jgi:hypothetical protein
MLPRWVSLGFPFRTLFPCPNWAWGTAADTPNWAVSHHSWEKPDLVPPLCVFIRLYLPSLPAGLRDHLLDCRVRGSPPFSGPNASRHRHTFILNALRTVSLVLCPLSCPCGRRAVCRPVVSEGPSEVLLNFGRQGYYEVEAQRPGPLTPLVQVLLGCLLSAQGVPGSLLFAWSFLTRAPRAIRTGHP